MLEKNLSHRKYIIITKQTVKILWFCICSKLQMPTRLTCMCTCPCAGDHMHLREYYEHMFERKPRKKIK